MQRFGAFDVDFTTDVVRKSGVRIRVQEQPLRVLQALVERPGELVTREELRDRLWPSNTFVDFERSLNAAVGKLRQSLNDSADRPIYIETVARKGYRFIAPVIDVNTEALPPAAAEKPAAQPPAHRLRLRWVTVAGLVAGLGAVLWAAWPGQRVDPAGPVWLDLDVGGDVSQAAITPDGTTLAFVTGGRLAVRRLAQNKITPLAGTEGATSPFFSPDGQWLGYFSDHKLRKLSLQSGDSVTLCDAAVDRGATWTDDGHIIAALSATGELSSVPASGGNPQKFTELKGERPEVTDHRLPVRLPGGKGVLFIAGSGTATGSLRVLPSGSRRPKTLVENASVGRYLPGGYLLYHQGGTLFGAPLDLNRLELTGPASPLVEGAAYDHFRGADFDVSASGTLVFRRSPLSIRRFATWIGSSGVEDRVLAEPGEYTSPRMSPDGKQLALASPANISIYDSSRQKMTPLTFGAPGACCPVWSPDGEYLVFASQFALSWIRSDGSGSIQRLPAPQGVRSVPFSFSRDGKWLAFHRNTPQTGYDIWVAPVDRTGGTLRLGEPRVLLRQAGLQTAPSISPDDRWIAYGSDDETGRMEVYVIPFSAEGPTPPGKWQISTEGGRGARWSGPGEILYRGADNNLMAATIRTIGNSLQSDKPRTWSTRRLADLGPQPNFDVLPGGNRVLALVDADEKQRDDTHLHIVQQAGLALSRQRADLRK